MVSQALPSDVLALVIASCDADTLSLCSLVNSAFLQESRRHIYYRICVSRRNLSPLLTHCSSFFCHTREVTLYARSTHPKERAQILQIFLNLRMLTSLDYRGYNESRDRKLVARIAALPTLLCLNMSLQIWEYRETMLEDGILDILQAPRLRSLSLDVYSEKPFPPGNVVKTIPTLTSLHLGDTKFDGATQGVQRWARWLNLSDIRIMTLKARRAAIPQLPRGNKLEKLFFREYPDPRSLVDAIPNFPNLQELIVAPQEPEYIVHLLGMLPHHSIHFSFVIHALHLFEQRGPCYWSLLTDTIVKRTTDRRWFRIECDESNSKDDLQRVFRDAFGVLDIRLREYDDSGKLLRIYPASDEFHQHTTSL
ncbi:hypothetical protein DL96DRAFT_1607508 [Flagelloscypha sp. PMI_526]|nr:hypothetical protein DL96DRAFT_1607508 [Flagelloscypha sp. PMI_526]